MDSFHYFDFSIPQCTIVYGVAERDEMRVERNFLLGLAIFSHSQYGFLLYSLEYYQQYLQRESSKGEKMQNV